MAMAIFGMGVVLAPAMGPILGGWLTDNYGWPWVFYINIPVSIVGIVMFSAFVEDPPYLRRGIARVDWAGIALLTLGLIVMQIVLERGNENNWFHSSWITAGAIMTVLMLTALVFWELRIKEPIINFRVLRNIPLSIGAGMGLLFGVVLFGTTFSLPQLTQRLLRYPAYQAGLVLLPRAITLFLAMPVVGWLYNYVDSRLLIAVGIGLTYLAFHQLAHLSLNVGFWNLVPIMLIMGAGLPCMFVTLSTASLSTVRREDMTAATSLYTLARRVGGNLGYALVATLVERFSVIHQAHLSAHISNLNSATLAIMPRWSRVWRARRVIQLPPRARPSPWWTIWSIGRRRYWPIMTLPGSLGSCFSPRCLCFSSCHAGKEPRQPAHPASIELLYLEKRP